MDEQNLQNYLRDTLRLIIEKAIEAKRMSKSAKHEQKGFDSAFEEGRALAYYEIVTILISEATTFGLSTHLIPELDFDPDKELLS